MAINIVIPDEIADYEKAAVLTGSLSKLYNNSAHPIAAVLIGDELVFLNQPQQPAGVGTALATAKTVVYNAVDTAVYTTYVDSGTQTYLGGKGISGFTSLLNKTSITFDGTVTDAIVKTLHNMPKLTTLVIAPTTKSFTDAVFNTAVNVHGVTSLQISGITLSSLTVPGKTETLTLTNVTTLAALNVTGSGGMETLQLSGCTNLASVNITNLASLKTLNISTTPAAITGLTTATGLESLAITSNSAITAVDLCIATILKTLSLNTVPVTSISIESISGLESLELTAIAMTGLSLIGKRALKTLVINDTDFTMLVVDEMPLLETVTINANINQATLEAIIDKLYAVADELGKNECEISITPVTGSVKTAVMGSESGGLFESGTRSAKVNYLINNGCTVV